MKIMKKLVSISLVVLMLMGMFSVNSLAGAHKTINGIDSSVGFTPSSDYTKSLYIDFDATPNSKVTTAKGCNIRFTDSTNNYAFVRMNEKTGVLRFTNKEATSVKDYGAVLPLDKTSHVTMRFDWSEEYQTAEVTTYVNGINVLESSNVSDIGYRGNDTYAARKDWKICEIYSESYEEMVNQETLSGNLVTTGTDEKRIASDAEYSTNLKSNTEDVAISGTIGSFELKCLEGMSLNEVMDCASVKIWTGGSSYQDVTGAEVKAYESNGTTPIADDADLQAGNIIRVKSANGKAANDYTVTVQELAEATVSSTEYTVDTRKLKIGGVLRYTKVSDFLSRLTPETDCAIDGVYSDGTKLDDSDYMKGDITLTLKTKKENVASTEYVIEYTDITSRTITETNGNANKEIPFSAKNIQDGDNDIFVIHSNWTTTAGAASVAHSFNIVTTGGEKGLYDAMNADKTDPDIMKTLDAGVTYESGNSSDIYLVVDLKSSTVTIIVNGTRVGYVNNTLFLEKVGYGDVSAVKISGGHKGMTADVEIYKIDSAEALIKDKSSNVMDTIKFSNSGTEISADVEAYDQAEARLYIAEYKNDEFVGISVGEKKVAASGIISYKASITPDNADSELRAFFWNSDLTPIASDIYSD